MSEYQKYLNRQPSRRDKEPPPVVPVFVCPRCNKLVMPERSGRKQYCSICTDQARTEKYRENAPADEGRDYQWLYRLQNLTPDVRKVFLKSPKSRDRCPAMGRAVRLPEPGRYAERKPWKPTTTPSAKKSPNVSPGVGTSPNNS